MGRRATKQTHGLEGQTKKCFRMKSWVPSIGSPLPSPNMQGAEARQSVQHDGGEPNAMQTRQIREYR